MPGHLLDILQFEFPGMAIGVTHVDRAWQRLTRFYFRHALQRMTRQANPAQARSTGPRE